MTLTPRPQPYSVQIVRQSPQTYQARQILRGYVPKSLLGKAVIESFKYLPPDLAEEILEKLKSSLVAESALSLKVYRGLGLYRRGLIDREDVRIEDYGIVGRRQVTDVGAGYIVDALQNLTEGENLKYHALGTGTTAEAANGAGAAMVTELTTEYNPNSTRATGTTTELSAQVYRSVATNTLDGTPGAALREHGLCSASSAGTVFDRTLYSAVTVSSGDGVQSTYDWTLNSGG